MFEQKVPYSTAKELLGHVSGAVNIAMAFNPVSLVQRSFPKVDPEIIGRMVARERDRSWNFRR